MVKKIIIDTDPAIGIAGTDADDPIAIMLALCDSRLDLLAITTVFGNCPPLLGARCAARILAAHGSTNIPIAVGQSVPLSGTLPDALLQAYAGARGREGSISLPSEDQSHCHKHASELIIELVRQYPHQITIVAIGAQSNLAMALLKAPDIAPLIKEVVMMAGALGLNARWGRGNITPVAECNIWFDPHAADLVFRAKIPITMVSLDVTNADCGLVLMREDIEPIRDTNAFITLFKEICHSYFEAPMFEWSQGCVLYDPLAVWLSADNEIADYQPMAIGIETQGILSYGQTVPLRNQTPNVRVCSKIDGRKIVYDIIETIVSACENR